MKRFYLLLLGTCLMTTLAWAQKSVVSGVVTNAKTGKPVPQATVSAQGTEATVVTNDEGFFTLKTDQRPQSITISHLGYDSQQHRLTPTTEQPLRIGLKPNAVALREVVVWTGNPRELVNIAISKIPDNYSPQAELYDCFYRETAMKQNHFVYVAEGVVDMYKTAYTRNADRDRVAIRKGRRLISPRRNDTLTVKVIGGPLHPVQLDVAKNRDFLFNETEMNCYAYRMEEPETIDDRLQYVVSMTPNADMPYALYFVKLYIDHETLAFTRAEVSLDMSDRLKATRYMLVKKPAGVRFKPKEMSVLIDYRYDEGVTRISYIRTTFRFNCDWRRRLFATQFTATCEMVVTDRQAVSSRPISGHASFDAHDAFYDRVDFFLDPNFWEDYNIIEPTSTLDKAIDRLIKLKTTR